METILKLGSMSFFLALLWAQEDRNKTIKILGTACIVFFYAGGIALLID
jgi:hypothetical protein